MKRILTILALVISITAAAQTHVTIKPEAHQGGSSFPSGEQFKTAQLTYQVISAPNNTWCYNILRDGTVYIHQPSKPGMAGNEGFKTKETAASVAQLVIGKMKKGEMPPSVTEEELKKLKAL